MHYSNGFLINFHPTFKMKELLLQTLRETTLRSKDPFSIYISRGKNVTSLCLNKSPCKKMMISNFLPHFCFDSFYSFQQWIILYLTIIFFMFLTIIFLTSNLKNHKNLPPLFQNYREICSNSRQFCKMPSFTCFLSCPSFSAFIAKVTVQYVNT